MIEKINKNFLVIVAILFLFFGLAFYWYEYKPKQIRKACAERASRWANIPTGERQPTQLDEISVWNATYDQIYKLCLNEKGEK